MANPATAGFMPGEKSSRSGKAGQARMKEIAAENEVEIKALVEGLLADIGRTPTQSDRIAAELLASIVVKARRRRASGRSDALYLRQLPELMRAWPPSSQPRAEESPNAL